MIVLSFLLGTIIGSFINAVAYRLPRDVSWTTGHSRCPNCNAILRWLDLIPIMSYLMLRGRCRYCKHHFSARYIGVELLFGALFTAAYFSLISMGWPYLIFCWAIISIVLLLALIDLSFLILPDKILLFLLVISLGYLIAYPVKGYSMKLDYINALPQAGLFQSVTTGAIICAAAIIGILTVIWLLTKGRAFGLGDAKYLAVLAITFGPWGVAVVSYIAIFLGALTSIMLLAIGRANMKTAIPFGVFISIGVIVYLFLGITITTKLYLYFV